MIYSLLAILFTYIVRADSSIYREPFTYLYGNVELEIDSVKLHSNSALVTDDSIRVWGNLEITKGKLTVYGGLGRYFFDKIYHITNGIRAQSGKDTLRSEGGLLYGEKDEVYLKDSLQIWNDERRIQGDDGLYNFRKNTGFVRGNVRLTSYQDTVVLSSDSVTIYGDTLLIAKKNVLEKGRFRVFSDTLIYYIDKDSLLFWGNPIAITDLDSLSSDYIEVIIKEHKIVRLRARGDVRGNRKE